MECYMDRCWCRTETCRHYQTCERAQPYAMKKQAKECPDVRDRIPYAVRDMSDVCKEYEREREYWEDEAMFDSMWGGMDQS